MELLFIDEVFNEQKNPDFLGVGVLKINIAKYKQFKQKFIQSFFNMEWSQEIEFKGRYIFSKKGDKSVSIEKRICFIEEIVKASIANQNATYSFWLFYGLKGNSKEHYKNLLFKALRRIVRCPKRKRGNGKEVFGLFLDSRDDIKPEELALTLDSIFETNKCILLERPFFVKSSNFTPGIVAVDILSYLAMWFILDNNSSLFEDSNVSISKNNERKLETIKELLASIKNKRFICIDA